MLKATLDALSAAKAEPAADKEADHPPCRRGMPSEGPSACVDLGHHYSGVQVSA